LIPIRELLGRIRWDPVFGRGVFEPGYLDHLRGGIVRVPVSRVSLPPGDHFSVTILGYAGAEHSIPYHRNREVIRNGTLNSRRALA
jgi:uncharacterized protein (UPF0248 family)